MIYYQAKCANCGALVWCSEARGRLRHDQQQAILEAVENGFVVDREMHGAKPDLSRCVCGDDEQAGRAAIR